jgi:hypothetical protein
MSYNDEKKNGIQEAPLPDIVAKCPEDIKDENQFEIFKKGEDAVDFRKVGWIRASIIFVKGITPILRSAGILLMVV